jgi:hypothetical protein
VSSEQLGTVCGWLAGAVERHLSSAVAGPDNLSALHKCCSTSCRAAPTAISWPCSPKRWRCGTTSKSSATSRPRRGVHARAASLAGRTVQDRPIVFPTQSLPLELRVTRIPQTDINGMEAPVLATCS